MRRSSRLFPLLVLLLVAPSSTVACLWDRDTLAHEAKGHPYIVDVLLGRVDRWPSAVYAMRLDAVVRDLAADPSRLDLYDDAAVACERLGRHGEAIEWLHRKRDLLDSLPAGAVGLTDHEYRFHANLGTVLAHRWINAGAPRDDAKDLTQSIAHIRTAITLNQEAHFGREPVQLAMLERLASTGSRPDKNDLYWLIDPIVPEREDAGAVAALRVEPSGVLTTEDLIEGLVGLIVLGSAWESVDVYGALAEALARNGDAALAGLALSRAADLAASGHRSLVFGDRTADAIDELRDRLSSFSFPAVSDDYYASASEWVKRETARREAHIANELASGSHPDTDPGFMDSFRPTPRPPLPAGFLGTNFDRSLGWTITAVGAGLLIAVSALVAAVFGVRMRANERARASGATDGCA